MKHLNQLISKLLIETIWEQYKTSNSKQLLTYFYSESTGRIKIGDLIGKLKEIGYFIPPDSKIMKLYQEDK